MTSRTLCLACTLACVAAAGADARAQGRRGPGGVTTQANGQGNVQLRSDPFAGPVVTNAPFSADAVTTITQTLSDGTRIEQKAEARLYRDSAGRLRGEQTILGLNWANPAAQTLTVITITPAPDDGTAYTLDSATRTARRVPRGVIVFGTTGLLSRVTVSNTIRLKVGDGLVNLNGVPPTLSPPTADGGRTEELDTRQIEGVRTIGRKTTSTIPTGQVGNDRPIEITDERWESPDLKMLISSRFSDPRTGVVDFKLININRAEPAPDLFTVPSDYTVIEPGAGGRAGGPGLRGRQ